MLNKFELRDGSFGQDPFSQNQSPTETTVDLNSLVAATRRQARVIGVCSLVGLTLGMGYVLLAAPQYTANALMMIDNRRVRAVQESYDDANLAAETAVSTMDSQVEVLKSDKMALTVIDALKLAKDPEFARVLSSGPGLFSRLQSGLQDLVYGASHREVSPRSETEKARGRLADVLRRQVNIRRLGRTFVFEISYTSFDPVKAAAIANCYADAYLQDQLQAKTEATRRASAWLEERLTELKRKALESDLAVQKFRSDNNLISSGGRLVSEQQLGEANSQLMNAHLETARATARYDKLRTIIDNHQMGALVSESLGSAVNDQLRTKYLAASKRWTEIVEKLGEQHNQAVLLRAEMREYERQMFAELKRLEESARSDLDIAREREKSLTDSVSRLMSVNATENQTLVTLRELEREAEAHRNLYQSFLRRHQESLQQQSFPMAGARVISEAATPPFPSRPKKALVLPLWFVLGGFVGAAIGAVREMRDTGFRTGNQIREHLGLEFLGIAPLLKSAPAPDAEGRTVFNVNGAWRKLIFHCPKPLRHGLDPLLSRFSEALRAAKISADGDLPDPHGRTVFNVNEAGQKLLFPCSKPLRHVLDHPLSRFSEVLRAAKISADGVLPDQQTKYIGVVSLLPGEGKSLIAKNFGSLLAHLGARTLLIDLDLRRPGLTRGVAPTAREGVLEAVLDGRNIEDLLLIERDSGLSILPAVVHRPVFHSSELLCSDAMKTLLKEAEGRYNYVLLDLPPIGPVVDARALAPQIDAFLFVVEWGRTSRKALREALSSDLEVRNKCLGVVLNKVDSGMLKMYEHNTKDYAGYYHGE